MSQQSSGTHHAQHPHGKKPRSTGRVRRLILWEWGIVLALLSGLAITVMVISHAPDPKSDADALVARMKAAAVGRPYVVMGKVPPKVCVMAGWELYRTGLITVNGVTPQRISAAILVDLCNQGETATLQWTPKTGN